LVGSLVQLNLFNWTFVFSQIRQPEIAPSHMQTDMLYAIHWEPKITLLVKFMMAGTQSYTFGKIHDCGSPKLHFW